MDRWPAFGLGVKGESRFLLDEVEIRASYLLATVRPYPDSITSIFRSRSDNAIDTLYSITTIFVLRPPSLAYILLIVRQDDKDLVNGQ